jgi:hypothetical protein
MYPSCTVITVIIINDELDHSEEKLPDPDPEQLPDPTDPYPPQHCFS